MQIDWVTVAAQIVNFLVLVWLLRRFLYRPVLRAMEERQSRIRTRIEEAGHARAAAEEERRALEEERKSLVEAREEALRAARDEADALRRRLEGEARAEHDKARIAGHAQVAQEREEFLLTLRREAAAQFDALARAALTDLAGADLEARAAAAFAAELEKLDEDDRKAFAAAASAAGHVTVQSAFELDAEVRRRVTRAIHETIAPDTEVIYERADRLIFGLRLRAGGRVAQWTLDSYLDHFERELSETLSEHTPAARNKAAE